MCQNDIFYTISTTDALQSLRITPELNAKAFVPL